MDITLGQRYANALEQLLPNGWAWQKRGCDDSLLGRILRAPSEELARFHVWLEQSVKDSIERFADIPQGWSAPDYERLLADKFGITAVVTDGLEPFTCESSCESPLLDERIVYVYVITVDNVADVTATARDYLRQYQQSHTHYHIRDREITATTDYDNAAFSCESACEDPLYERDYHAMTYHCDWSYAFDEIPTLPGWPAIAASVRDHTTLRRDDAPH